MTTILVTIAFFAVIMLSMAVGVIFSGRCLRGSCGGSQTVIGPDGEPIRCASCPRRREDEAARRAALEASYADDDDDGEDGGDTRLITPVASSGIDR